MKWGLTSIVCVAGALVASAAYADPTTPTSSLDSSTTDTTRGTPDYNSPLNQATGEGLEAQEPYTGIHMGGFMLYPTLEGDVTYNDNIFAAETDTVSDEIYKVKPGLSLQSTWSVNQLNAWANLDSEFYDHHSDQDQENYSLGTNGMLEASYATHFYGSTEFDHLTEEFGNTNLPTNALEPTKYTDWASELGIAQRFTRLTFHLGGTYSILRFENTLQIGGGLLPEDLRDRNVSTEYLDAGYEFSPGYSVFTRGTVNQREYSNSSFGPRDSNGYEADVGLRAEITRLITGEAWVGYLTQDYKGFSSVNGPSFGVTGVWSATPLLSITSNIARTLEETDETGSSSYFASGGTLTADYRISHTVTLHLGMAYTRNDYQGIDRHENVYGPTAGIDYSLTPRLVLGLSYIYACRDSTVPDSNYSQNQASLALKLAL